MSARNPLLSEEEWNRQLVKAIEDTVAALTLRHKIPADDQTRLKNFLHKTIKSCLHAVGDGACDSNLDTTITPMAFLESIARWVLLTDAFFSKLRKIETN